MTELSQRIALAKLRGMQGPWEMSYECQIEAIKRVADYHNAQGQRLPELNLDELHEAEKCVADYPYTETLSDVCLKGMERSGTWTLESISQVRKADKYKRSEALLKSVGLWEEDE